MTESEKLRAVLECDGAYDGRFFYAVRSTGIYCRPSCKSRPPRPENIEYFDTVAEAEAAGYRPCKRCRPDVPDYDPDAGCTATEAASAVGMGSAAFSAFFRRQTGVTPREYASQRSGGETVCVVDSPVGLLRISESEAGITGIAFAREGEAEAARGVFIPEAKRQLDEYFAGRRREFDLPLDLRGTEFQRRVWAQLCRIPYGETRSYQDIAAALGNAKASRAVGMANNRNPVVIVVPCHRVVGKGGSLVGYAGGLDRKEFLLKLEAEHGRAT